MISQNKNKITKELTLEEIIQKSCLRKNIDSICLIQSKLNKDQNNSTSLVQTPNYLNKRFQELLDMQFYPLKNQTQVGENTKQKKNSFTARTIKSSNAVSNKQFTTKNFNTVIQNKDQLEKEFKKSTQDPVHLLNKNISQKNKTKKRSDYLCVSGISGNIVTKPLTSDDDSNQIPQYQLKKYQTIIQLDSDFQKNQKSLQFASVNHEPKQTKKYNSFILTKYTTANNFYKKSTKSILNKNEPTSKLKSNIIFPQELVNKKIHYRGIKTEEKNRVKVDNVEEQFETKNNKIPKIQPLHDKYHDDQIKNKQKNLPQSSKSKTKSKTQNKLTHIVSQIEIEKRQKDVSLSKKARQESLNRKDTKGFIGTKRRSGIPCDKIKPKYFIPDFIKPSLDYVMFEKKLVEVIKTQQKQNKLSEREKKKQGAPNGGKNRQNQTECIKGQSLNLNGYSDYYKVKELIEFKEQNGGNEESNIQGEAKLDISERDNMENNKALKRRKTGKNNPKESKAKLPSLRNEFQQIKICGWEDNQKSSKKGKNRMFMNLAAEFFEL